MVSAPLTSSPWVVVRWVFRGVSQFHFHFTEPSLFIRPLQQLLSCRDRPCCYHETPLCLNSILLRIAPARPLLMAR